MVWRLFLRAVFTSFISWLLISPIFLAAIIGAGGAGAGVLFFYLTLPTLIFWGVLLFSRRVEPVAEWRVLLADRSNGVEAVYRQVAGTLHERKLPIRWEARRIRTDLGARNISHRLVLTDVPCTAIVSVFGYGTSLYLGWTMWRSRRGYALFGRFVADLYLSATGQNSPEQVVLRSERLRAMREAVHAACREGLVVAVEGRKVEEWVGFPEGLPPIEDERRPSGPRPSGPGASGPGASAPRPSGPRHAPSSSWGQAPGPGPSGPTSAPRPAASPAPYGPAPTEQVPYWQHGDVAAPPIAPQTPGTGPQPPVRDVPGAHRPRPPGEDPGRDLTGEWR